jgi:hypothetical protein
VGTANTSRSALVASSLLLTGGFALPLPAHAQDAPLRLEWSAPSGCPDQLQVLERVRAYLKIDRWPAAAEFPVAVRARVRALRQQLSLQLDVSARGERSQRTLVDADCEVLADGAALLIAIALAPAIEAPPPSVEPPAPPIANSAPHGSTASSDEQPSSPPEPSSPDAQREATASSVPNSAATHEHGPARKREPRSATAANDDDEDAQPPGSAPVHGPGLEPMLAFGLGLVLYSDLVPAGPAPGVELAAELLLRPWRIGLGLGFAPPNPDHPPRYASARFSNSAGMLTIWPCYDVQLTPLAIGLCACGELGTVVARVSAIDDPQTTRSTWIAGGAGLSLRYAPLRHLSAALDLRALRAASDLHFVIGTPAGDVELHRTGPISLRFALRIAWTL